MRLYILLTALFIQVNVFAQNEVNELIKGINEKIKNSKSVKIRMSYNYYDSPNSNTIIQNEKGLFIKSIEGFYSHIQSIETISDNKYQLTIDNETKNAILINSNNGYYEQFYSPKLIDSLITKTKLIQTEQLTNDEIKIIINIEKLSTNGIKKYEIFASKSQLTISKLVMHFHEMNDFEKGSKKINPRIEIVYHEYLCSDENDFFDKPKLESYIIKNGLSFTLNDKFKSFKFYNNIL